MRPVRFTRPTRLRQRFVRAVAAAFVLVFALGMSDGARAQTEADVKAAFVFNFARFAEWPPEAFTATSRLNLCVVGADDAMAAALGALEGKSVQSREIRVLRNPRREELRSCHVAWLGRDVKGISELLGAPGAGMSLIVGDSEGFIDSGGMIGLHAADRRLVFDVNLDNVNRTRVRLSSHVLKLARSVRGSAQGGRP